MSQDSVEKLLGRLLTDDDLRQRVLIDIKKACMEEGLSLNTAEMDMIKPEDIIRISMVSSWINRGIKRNPLKVVS